MRKLFALYVVFFLLFLNAHKASAGQCCSDLLIVMQKFLDSDALAPYWHNDVFPERVPLSVTLPVGHENIGPCLKKFGRPVRYQIEISSEQSFVIHSIFEEPSYIQIEFSYAVEGLLGEVKYTKQQGEWYEDTVRLVEK